MARYTDNTAKEIFSSNLTRIMSDRDIDAPKLASMIDVEKQAVYSWVKMRSFPSTNNIQKLIDVLHVTSDDLLAIGGSVTHGLELVPLYGSVAAGVPIEMLHVDDMKEAPSKYMNDDADCFMVRVRGNSMNRIVHDGELALISPKHHEMNEHDVFLVSVNGDDATIKHIHKLENGIELVPDSYDPTYRSRIIDFGDGTDQAFKIIGKVVWWCADF